MSIAKTIIIDLLNLKTYIWVDVLLIKETKKAILIEFDGRKAWILKAWIIRIQRDRKCEILKIKIPEYYWTKKIF